MRETAIFFAYLFACLLLAALLTAPLMQTGWIDHDPHRVMGRLAQVFILLGLWPFLRAMGLANWHSLGYGAPRPVFAGALWRGWLAGVAILMVLVAALLALGVRVPDAPSAGLAGALAGKVLQALVAGLLIGLLEETFFRGALYAAIRRRGGVWPAVFWTALLYALLHVMKPHPLPDGIPFDGDAALTMFVQVFTGVLQWKHADSLAALLMVGVLLGLVRERTGHIGWCIGLHAGWVFVIQLARRLTDGDPASPHAWLTGDYDGIIGWMAAAWIGLLALAYWRLSERRSQQAEQV